LALVVTHGVAALFAVAADVFGRTLEAANGAL